MLFNSLSFAIFLPIVFAAYWLCPQKHRWCILLLSSYYFYMSWNIKYIVLIVFTTILSYSCAILVRKAETERKKKLLVASTVLISFGILFVFKYFNFMSKSITDILGIFALQVHPITLKLLLPVGISFYTFQTVSYLLDVYHGKIEPEYHLGIYATFITFFPQLVAGPIGRAKSLLPQFKEKHEFNYDQAVYGVKLIAWGFFKKMVIADTLAIYVDRVYNSLDTYKGFSLLLCSLFFTFQIYCDFSGYSDIAIGTAKLFGIDLMTNFKSPYFSSSLHEFWSRWHISLSTWFRDYVYIPLGGNRVSRLRNATNVIITFLVSGLWHGAKWTYVLWGLAHGLGQVAENLITKKNRSEKKSSIRLFVGVVFTFTFCSFAWIFFRANSLHDVNYMFSNMFVGIMNVGSYITLGIESLQLSKSILAIIFFVLLVLVIYEFFSRKEDALMKMTHWRPVARWGMYAVFLLILILFSEKGATTEFIYFQF